jgi:hypothetical protein
VDPTIKQKQSAIVAIEDSKTFFFILHFLLIRFFEAFVGNKRQLKLPE